MNTCVYATDCRIDDSVRFVIACECTYLVQALGILWFLRAKCIFWRMPSWRSDWYVPPFLRMSITAVTFDVNRESWFLVWGAHDACGGVSWQLVSAVVVTTEES